jgi:nitrate/TMAO reductase-like tetraheme cytochrome c subunit
MINRERVGAMVMLFAAFVCFYRVAVIFARVSRVASAAPFCVYKNKNLDVLADFKNEN